MMMDERLKLWLTGLVSLGWLINLVVPIFVHSYSSSLAANAPLLLILGSLFQSRNGKRSRTRGGSDENQN